MSNEIPQTAPSGSSSLGQECKKLGYSLYVWQSENRLECRLTYVPHDQGSMINRTELLQYLAQYTVKEEFLITDAINQFLVKAAAGQALTRELIAIGVAPVDGNNEELIMTAQASVSVTHVTDKNAKESIDLHNVQTFINVQVGDEIARIRPLDHGIAGRALTGKPIPAEPGKPLQLKIGEHIESVQDETGIRLIARVAGRVCQASGEIDVSQEYVIAGDVNFRIGSIDFNGFVEVRGDILDDFNVHATKGLKVSGNIGVCTITSQGDISFCGMDGGDKGVIRCGGNLKANFIHDVDVECDGDVEIDVEIHNCRVKTLGKLIVNKGAITGGSCSARGGIQTLKSGSAASVRTALRAGADYRHADRIDQLLADLEENSAQSGQTDSLNDLEALRQQRKLLTEELKELKNRSAEFANPKINVKKILYDNSYLRLGSSPWERVDERDGPFSVIENSLEGGFRFLGMTSLDVKAADIEKAFIQHEAGKS